MGKNTNVTGTDQQAPPSRPWRRRLPRLVLGLVLAYALWLLGLYLFQGRLIFASYAAGSVDTEGGLPGGVEEIEIRARGPRVVAWFASGWRVNDVAVRPAVLFCHGNAELIDDCLDLARMYQARGIGVMLLEYRGYGRSGGSPSQETLVGDAEAAFDLLAARQGVDPERIILHGRSLGGGVLAQVAERVAKRPGGPKPAGLIMESSFTSVAAMSGRYLAPSWLVRHPFHTDRIIAGLGLPILLVHGTDDGIVPASHSRRLRELAPSSTLVELPGGHDDLMGRNGKAFGDAIGAFLSAHSLADPVGFAEPGEPTEPVAPATPGGP